MQAESAFTEITSKSCGKKLLQSVIAHPVLISDYLVPKLQETMQVFFFRYVISLRTSELFKKFQTALLLNFHRC